MPTIRLVSGWLCFVVSISVIGILTALIGERKDKSCKRHVDEVAGDVASMFGCEIGIKDSVTAITLVA